MERSKKSKGEREFLDKVAQTTSDLIDLSLETLKTDKTITLLARSRQDPVDILSEVVDVFIEGTENTMPDPDFKITITRCKDVDKLNCYNPYKIT